MFSKYKREKCPSEGHFYWSVLWKADWSWAFITEYLLFILVCLLTSFMSSRLTVPRVRRVEISLVMIQNKKIPLKCIKTKVRSLFSKYDEYKVEMFVLKWLSV